MLLDDVLLDGVDLPKSHSGQKQCEYVPNQHMPAAGILRLNAIKVKQVHN
jgi:hypothetical protein